MTNAARAVSLYLLGIFPVQLEEKDLLDRMIKFCLYNDAHPARVHYDKAVFKVIQSQRPNGAFLTSFGVPIREGRIEDRGFWYTCHEVPERSLNLKLYVPCFRDRWLGEASLRLSELSRISGHTLNFCKLQTVWALMCIYARRYTLEGAMSGEGEQMEQAGSVQMSLSIRFPYTKHVLRII